jgi:mono/diheme cytochrome c family protein
MKRSWWRTGPPKKHTEPVRRPTVGQLLRQSVVLLAIVALWGGSLLMLLGATSSLNVAFVAEQGTPERKATSTVHAIATPTVAATSTATAVPASPTPTASVTALRGTTASSTAAAVATTTATSTATAKVTAAAPDTPTPRAVTATLAPTGAASGAVSFARDVQPIFEQVCVKCHGGDKIEEGLVLNTYADVMQGSNNGPVVVPGDPANSLMVDLIKQGKMPKRGPKLLPKQIQAIVAWVTAGASNN